MWSYVVHNLPKHYFQLTFTGSSISLTVAIYISNSLIFRWTVRCSREPRIGQRYSSSRCCCSVFISRTRGHVSPSLCQLSRWLRWSWGVFGLLGEPAMMGISGRAALPCLGAHGVDFSPTSNNSLSVPSDYVMHLRLPPPNTRTMLGAYSPWMSARTGSGLQFRPHVFVAYLLGFLVCRGMYSNQFRYVITNTLPLLSRVQTRL
jgi:hypothetical protein